MKSKGWCAAWAHHPFCLPPAAVSGRPQHVVYLGGGVAPRCHGPDHERGTARRVAGKHHVVGHLGQLGLKESHGQQGHVGLDYLGLACRHHQRAAAFGVGLPLNLLHLHTRQPAVLAKELQCVYVPAPRAALFVARSGLQCARESGPGVLRVVGACRRHWHDFYLCDAAAALTVGRAYAVAAGVAAANHEHILAPGAHRLVFVELHSGQHSVLLGQHVEREIYAAQFAPRHLEVAGGRRAGGYHVGVEAVGQLVDVYLNPAPELNALAAHHLQPPVYYGLVELEVGNAVAQQPAGGLVAVEHGDRVARQVEPVGRHQPCRACPHHAHPPSVALGVLCSHIVFVESHLRDGRLVLAVGGRFVLHEVEHTRLFAQRGAHAARKLGEVVGRVEQSVGQFVVAPAQRVVPLGRLVAQRTGPVAERHAAVHAAACLRASVVGVESLLHFAEVVYSVVYRSVTGFLPVYG